jgi:hypothetical protein
MTDAEKEATRIVRTIFGVAVPDGVAYLPDWRVRIWANRILRFAHEYGPEIAMQEMEQSARAAWTCGTPAHEPETTDNAMMPTQGRVFARHGEPCPHPGCLSHQTHPCEVCGRRGGRGDWTETVFDSAYSGMDWAIPGSAQHGAVLLERVPCPTCESSGHTGVWNPERQAFDVCWECGDKGYVLRAAEAKKNERAERTPDGVRKAI